MPVIKVDVGIKPQEREKVIQREQVVQKVEQRQQPRQEQPQIPKLAQPQIQLFKQKQIPRQITQQIPRKKQIPKQPRKLKFIIPLPTTAKYILPKKRKIKQLGYIPEVRRRGEWFELKKETTPEKAIEKGAGFVRTTLGASFRVRKDGELLQIKSPSKFFKPAKKEKGVYVQKREYRLSTIPERREIQLAKKNRSIF